MLSDCRVISFNSKLDDRGNLTIIESLKDIPFHIKRIYYLNEVPENSVRGGHAHKDLHQVIIALAGSFEVLFDDGVSKKLVHLYDPNQGFYVAPMIWRDIKNFSEGSICLVLASEYFDESDYYRDYDEFIKQIG